MRRRAVFQDVFIRNLMAFILVEIGWGFGVNCASETAILPVLLRTLGASNQVLALLPAISIATAVVQPLAGFVTEPRPRTKRFVFWGYTGTVLFYAGMSGLIFGSPTWGLSPTVTIAGFLGLFLLLRGGCNFLLAPYTSLIGRALDPLRRGLGFGLIYALNTLAGIGGALTAAALLRESWPDHHRFALCLAGAYLGTGLGNLFILGVAEPPKRPEERLKLGAYLRQSLKEAWAIPGYRAFVFGRAFLTVHPLLLYFYVVQAGVSAATASVLMAVQTLGTCLGSLIGGRWGDLRGPRSVALGAVVSLSLALAVMMAGPPLAGLVIVAFLSGVFLAWLQVSQFGLVMALCPRPDPTAYFALVQCLLAPLAVAVPLVGGFLLDHQVSYRTVLGVALVMAVLGGMVWRVGLRDKVKR